MEFILSFTPQPTTTVAITTTNTLFTDWCTVVLYRQRKKIRSYKNKNRSAVEQTNWQRETERDRKLWIKQITNERKSRRAYFCSLIESNAWLFSNKSPKCMKREKIGNSNRHVCMLCINFNISIANNIFYGLFWGNKFLMFAPFLMCSLIFVGLFHRSRHFFCFSVDIQRSYLEQKRFF